VIRGTVPTAGDRAEIEREVAHLKGHGIAHMRDRLRVLFVERETRGLLSQTLIGAFATQEQTGFAEGYLEGHAYVKPRWMKVIAADGAGEPRATVHALLPEAFWEDAERLLREGRTLLVAAVDEVDAFAARELLDEETRSVETPVLPLEPARNAVTTLNTVREVEAASGGPHTTVAAQDVRRHTLDGESALHDR
jgi:hypothetical protein